MRFTNTSETQYEQREPEDTEREQLRRRLLQMILESEARRHSEPAS